MPAVTVPTPSKQTGLPTITNLTEGETVHQRCVLVHGKCASTANPDEAFISISIEDASGDLSFPAQTWPVADGNFKALLFLSPGLNKIRMHEGAAADSATELSVTYIPLLQNPPLHLAIMVAKDSPLLIDCPPVKQGALSSAHSSLDAAIAKFRLSAYMWQALTAEDMRSKGLGRRSFRLDEEWTVDTVSQHFVQGSHERALYESGAMRSTAKIHLIRSSRTVAELRDAQVAQQNKSAHRPQALFEYFMEALKEHGSPFDTSAHPIVAGMILDSHFSPAQNLILGHAALGCHNASGISLGMFGSHLTYSWPRFVEEVSSCLLDSRDPGETVGNDNGECQTLWEACSIGQGAFLHEVGHAFGAPHTTGIMARGYAQHWPRNFLPRTAYCAHTNKDGFVVVEGETENDARWDLKDALSFHQFPHFRVPGDAKLTKEARVASPSVRASEDEHETMRMMIECAAGLARIKFNGETEPFPSIGSPANTVAYTLAELEKRFKREEPLKLEIVGLNGKDRNIKDAWRTFQNRAYVRIPGYKVLLQKRAVAATLLEDGNLDCQLWEWATLLTHRKKDGTVKYATKVDCRTGMYLDGAYVYFGDRKIHCGTRRRKWGGENHFGGHAAEEVEVPEGEEIVKVEVSRGAHVLHGLRMHLSNGTAGGALSGGGRVPETIALEPGPNERIVGFYGRSHWGRDFDCLVEFGIITAPKEFELPEIAYSMDELKNTDGGIDPKDYANGGYECENDEDEDEDDDDTTMSDE